MLTKTPSSIEGEDRAISEYLELTDRLLTRLHAEPGWILDEGRLGAFPGAGPDPYDHCMISEFIHPPPPPGSSSHDIYMYSSRVFFRAPRFLLSLSTVLIFLPCMYNYYYSPSSSSCRGVGKAMFHLSFYYRADVAEVASRMYRISTRVWPGLDYVAERARAWNTTTTKDVAAPLSSDDDVRPLMPPPTRMREKVKRRIWLGIVSPNLTWKHSVAEDFKGTMSRLDWTKFDIIYIYVEEKKAKRIDPFVRENKEDGYVVLTKEPSNFGDGAWVRRWHPIVESMEFDILFYLDLTLGKMTTRLAMANFAPVQAVSHGHPLTSGISSSNMDYYISWGRPSSITTRPGTYPTNEYASPVLHPLRRRIHIVDRRAELS